MAISTKPKAKESTQNEDAISALINKGGSVATVTPPDNSRAALPIDKEQNVLLRVPQGLLDKLDAELNKGLVKKKRHPWILEAILEKLERSGALES